MASLRISRNGIASSPFERFEMGCTRPEHIARVLQRLYTHDIHPPEISAHFNHLCYDRACIALMYRHLAFVLIIYSLLALYTLKVDALAVTPQGSISPPTLHLTVPQRLLNETNAPPQNFVSYHVPNSPTTLEFHSFELTVPIDYFLRSIALAVGIVYDQVSERKGMMLIAGGIFGYSHEFGDGKEVVITVNDFREDGKPMTYFVLFDVLRGLGEFALQRGPPAREVSFEVEVAKIGYLATGYVDYKDTAPSTS